MTNSQYALLFIEVGGYRGPAVVVGASFWEADAYCRWRGDRAPDTGSRLSPGATLGKEDLAGNIFGVASEQSGFINYSRIVWLTNLMPTGMPGDFVKEKSTTEIVMRNGELSDIDDVLELHNRYQVDSITEEDKTDGFITTAFTRQQLADLINQENGLFIAKRDGAVVAYVMAASWYFWSPWPMFTFMIKQLPDIEYAGHKLSKENSYQYGPICIDKDARGTGILQKIFGFAKTQMSDRFPVLVTFVNKTNGRSYQAHKRKLGLDTVREFEFNNNCYYAMACLTKDK